MLALTAIGALILSGYLLRPAPISVLSSHGALDPPTRENTDPITTSTEASADTDSTTPVPVDTVDYSSWRIIETDWQELHFVSRLPDDPDAQLAMLMIEAEAGSASAANDLFKFTHRCTTRRGAEGPADHVAALDALCEEVAKLDNPNFLHWLERAVELGNHAAMTGYWEIVRQTRLLDPDGFSSDEWAVLSNRAVAHLERARDAGYVDAFFSIYRMRNGEQMDGLFDADPVSALAHLYAGIDLRRALDARALPGTEPPRVRIPDPGYEGRRRLEMLVPPYLQEEARERADAMLDRCCR